MLTEEPSAKDLLEGLLPRLLPADWTFRCIPYEGKQDLENRMGLLLRTWRNPEAQFLILRDQDSGDCHAIKADLVARCQASGRRDALVRIACRELEAWVVGDLPAFAEEFSVPAAARARNKAKFRNPDMLGNPVSELRHFVSGYQKRDGARRMGLRLNTNSNQSPSFLAFCHGVQKLVAA